MSSIHTLSGPGFISSCSLEITFDIPQTRLPAELLSFSLNPVASTEREPQHTHRPHVPKGQGSTISEKKRNLEQDFFIL